MGLPRFHSGQLRVYNELKRFNLLLAGRRWRKTTFGAAYLAKQAWVNQGTSYLWGSPTHDQNKIALGYFEKILKGKQYKLNRSTMDLQFPNGSLIQFRSLHKPDNARGFTLNGVVIDEAAYINEDSYKEVLRPTLMDTLGWSLLITTPSSYNWIADIYNIGNTNDSAVWRIPSLGVRFIDDKLIRVPHDYENPNLSYDEMISLLSTMTQISFRQEILCEFISSQLNPFSNIDELCTLKPHKAYSTRTVAGLDLAKTVDYTVLSIIDPKTRNEVYVEQLPHINYTEQVRYLLPILKRYNVGVISVDATGVGSAVVEMLYPQLQSSNILLNPVTFNNQVKVDLINDLILAMEQSAVRFIDDDRGIYQFRRYSREALSTGNIRYGAEQGAHDDFVTARSLSYHSSIRTGIFA